MADMPVDRLNDIAVLTRREIEARILKPVLEALAAEFGEERVRAIARDVIVEVARRQGRELAERMGGNGLDRFARALDDWNGAQPAPGPRADAG
jgi:L-2-amino-thiazoline-4-carboxylic acid hydrolase-like protein